MIRAVLDTNVVVSAHLEAEGREALILGLAIAGWFRSFASEALFAEYEGVLRRAKFKFDEKRVAHWLKEMRASMRLVKLKRKLQVTADPDDNLVLECALEARADYVVTGNLRHFPKQFQDIRVISPKQFLTVLAAEPGML